MQRRHCGLKQRIGFITTPKIAAELQTKKGGPHWAEGVPFQEPTDKPEFFCDRMVCGHVRLGAFSKDQGASIPKRAREGRPNPSRYLSRGNVRSPAD